MATKKEVPKAAYPQVLTKFDSLPDSAYARMRTVMVLFGCSRQTFWRWVKAGKMPQPVKFTARLVGWQVGELRKIQQGFK